MTRRVGGCGDEVWRVERDKTGRGKEIVIVIGIDDKEKILDGERQDGSFLQEEAQKEEERAGPFRYLPYVMCVSKRNIREHLSPPA